MPVSYIGADVDSKMTDLAVERGQKIVERYRVPTTVPALREVLGGIRRPRQLAFEEGPLAHWLWRNLRQEVDRLVVCDPRRNAYIARDGDKDDPIDAGKLAELLRGGFLREVYHSSDDRQTLLKRWVGLYHDRVGELTRQINKVRGCCRHYGVRPASACWNDPQAGAEWMRQMEAALREQLEVLWPSLEVAQGQVRACRRRLGALGKAYPIIQYWQALPGVGAIRSTTLYAYLDTPWRFRTPEKLCKYCGVGLERASSGKDQRGQPKKGLLQLAWQVNKRLKDAVMGAAVSAIKQGANPFAARYASLLGKGLTPANARHTVARKLLTVMWGMWKTNRPYDPALLERPGVDQ